MIRVAIADDHALLRRGLIELLREIDGMDVTAEAGSGDELLRLLRSTKVDVVVLDMNMPGPGGLDLVKSITSEFRSVPILVLSVHPEDQYAVRVVRAGAKGYLTKESAEAELVEAIRRVTSGQRYLSQNLAESLLQALESGTDGEPHATLSDREYQVMRLLASGMTASGIAERLSLSVKTISTYRSRLLQKMGLSNNAELTRYALERGLVD